MMLIDNRRAPKLSLSVSLSIAVHVLVLVIVAVVIYLQPAGTGLPMSTATPPQIVQATMISSKALSPPPSAEKPAEKPAPAVIQKQAVASPPPEKVEKIKPHIEDTVKPLTPPVDTKPAEIKVKPKAAKPKTASRHKAERKTVATAKSTAVDKKQQQLKQQQLAEQRQQALKALGEQSLTQAVAAQQLATAQDAYKSQISSSVAGVWINPFQGSTQMELMVAVTIDAAGNIVDTKITQNSGNAVFDRQALLAIHKAAPFSPPPLAQGETQFTFYLHFLNNDTVGAS